MHSLDVVHICAALCSPTGRPNAGNQKAVTENRAPRCCAEIDRLLREQKLQYVYNIDVVSYSKGGTRENFNFNGDEPAAGKPQGAAGAQLLHQSCNWQAGPVV